jgi:hypothetical protein
MLRYAQFAVRSRNRRDRMTFTFKLQRADGTPAEPPSIRSSVTNWRVGEAIPIGPDRTLRVVGTRSLSALE